MEDDTGGDCSGGDGGIHGVTGKDGGTGFQFCTCTSKGSFSHTT